MNRQVFLPADILLPKTDNMQSWSVIACDQFSSEREYWDRVKESTRGAYSTFNMVLPEAYLEEADMAKEIAAKNGTMEQYLQAEIFTEFKDSFIYVEREVTGGLIRRGLVGKIDLETYDYVKGTDAPVRASEKTVVDRLPPRISVRENAAIEMPHIMVLIDDASESVVEPISAKKKALEKVYDFDLMEGGGHITGWLVSGEDAKSVTSAMAAFADMPVQMVIGDGNHSLAAAKACWDKQKGALSEAERENHPARYALVELNNVYDSGIDFEPIHRVVFDTKPEKLVSELEAEMGTEGTWDIRCLTGGNNKVVKINAPSLGTMIDTLQLFLEKFVAENGGVIDYIHDDAALTKLAEKEGSVAFFLPPLDKADLFKTVISDGVFPKKSFSIGHARDKRYYLECKKIK